MITVTQAQMVEGIILSVFLGLAFGNFSTSPIYRLPRRESLFLKDPYCGDCNAKLMTRDLFPVFSWLMTRGKCRYCGANVPGAYALVEALCGVVYALCFVKWGFSESFLLVSFGLTALIMIAMMLYLDDFYSGKTVLAAMVLGALYRTLHDGTIYHAEGGAFAGMVTGGVAWFISGKKRTRDITAFPPYLGLLALAGIWLPFAQFLTVCLAALAARLMTGGRSWWVEWTILVTTSVEILAVLH